MFNQRESLKGITRIPVYIPGGDSSGSESEPEADSSSVCRRFLFRLLDSSAVPFPSSFLSSDSMASSALDAAAASEVSLLASLSSLAASSFFSSAFS